MHDIAAFPGVTSRMKPYIYIENRVNSLLSTAACAASGLTAAPRSSSKSVSSLLQSAVKMRIVCFRLFGELLFNC